MDKLIGMGQAQSQLAELVGRAASNRERFILEQQGKPMAVLLSLEDYQHLQRLEQVPPHKLLPPELRLRQEQLIAQAHQLRTRLGDPIDELAKLLSALPSDNDEFWLEVTEAAY